jgi:hypothetical protein
MSRRKGRAGERGMESSSFPIARLHEQRLYNFPTACSVPLILRVKPDSLTIEAHRSKSDLISRAKSSRVVERNGAVFDGRSVAGRRPPRHDSAPAPIFVEMFHLAYAVKRATPNQSDHGHPPGVVPGRTLRRFRPGSNADA